MNGNRLRELREAKGITATGIDEYLGVPRGSCVSWENGFSEPEEELIEDLAGYFRVSVKELTKQAVEQKTEEEKRTMAAEKNFRDEQKAEILKRAKEMSVAAAAREFGVTAVTIFRWKNAVKEGAPAEKPKAEVEAAPKKTTRKPKTEKAAVETEPKKTGRKPKTEKLVAEKATEKAVSKKTTRKPKAEKMEAPTEEKLKKTTRKPKAEKATTVEATEEADPKKRDRKTKAALEKKPTAEMQIILQSPFNHEITPEEIITKVPEGTENVYVRVDQNKLYWVKGEETGDVDIW